MERSVPGGMPPLRGRRLDIHYVPLECCLPMGNRTSRNQPAQRKAPKLAASAPSAPENALHTLLQSLYRSRIARILALLTAMAAAGAVARMGCAPDPALPESPGKVSQEHDPHAPRTFRVQDVLRDIEALDPERCTPEEYARLGELFERLNLATVEWHHPEGATTPQHPLLLIPFAHPDPNGNVRNEDQYALLHTTLVICRVAEHRGVRTFSTEGAVRGSAVDAKLINGATNAPFTPATLAPGIDSVAPFKRLLRQGVNVSTVYAAGMETPWKGAEDPEAIQALEQGNADFVRVSKATQEFLTALRNTSKYPQFDYRYNPDDDVITLNGHTAFPAAALERDLQAFVAQMHTDATGPVAKKREAAAAASPSGVLLFGTSHTPGILQAAKGKRSVAVVRPNGMPAHMTVERDPSVRNVENFLTLLKQLRARQ